jgi:hypothetical protein
MNRLLPLLFALATAPLGASVVVDAEAFGQCLGGWKARGAKAAEYKISDSGYRTWKPEVSPTPDGGIFVSVRIDHRRGLLASDDHANLELTFGPDGTLQSAQSSLALQGRRITSDLIRGSADLGGKAARGVVPGADRAVKIGADLVADLTEKLLREKIVEPGRVTYPAAIRHNFNHLYKAVRFEAEQPVELPADRPDPAPPLPDLEPGPADPKPKAPPAPPATGNPPAAGKPEVPASPTPARPAQPAAPKLPPPSAPEIKPFGNPEGTKPLPAKEQKPASPATAP